MLGFRVFRESGHGGIDTLDIEILDGDASRPLCTFHWQCNMDKEDKDWYAFRFQIERRDLSGLTESAALVRRVLRSLGREPGPAVIASKLERLSIWQVVYDSRVSELVYAEEVVSSEYQLYLEVVPGEKWGHVSCLARDIEEAQRLLGVKLAEGGYDEVLVKWIEGGKQVRCAYDGRFCRAPDVVPLEELTGGVE